MRREQRGRRKKFCSLWGSVQRRKRQKKSKGKVGGESVKD